MTILDGGGQIGSQGLRSTLRYPSEITDETRIEH